MRYGPIVLMCLMTLGATVSGCGADPGAPPAATDGAEGRGTSTGAAGPGANDEDTQVSIDPRITEACKIPTPHFGFDSAAVTPEARQTLEALATCLTEGPLKGEALKVVGHADPRGEFEYNLGLGHRRAGQVAEYLASAGLPDRRLLTTSRGELDARGDDEESWAEDRRVEILLKERVQ